MIDIDDFNRRFPDDDACLEYLKNILYPDGIYCKNCKRVTKHHKLKSRPSYSCDYCGHHIYPAANTMFHKSSTPLRYWFYAVYLVSDTSCRISVRQLQREIGVTYKTAWRIFHKIKEEGSLRNLREGGN
ncbi:IS1595 family transposase ISSpo3 [subsurface metagenome]